MQWYEIIKIPINLGGQEKIFIKILGLATEPLTKKKIQQELTLSHPQVRRYTAELVNRGLLQYFGPSGEYIATAKGNLYLKKKSIHYDNFLLDAYDISREIISLKPDNTLLDARNFMIRYNISRIVVSKDQRPIGIVTEKDISKYLYDSFTEKKLYEIMVKEVMKKNLVTINQNSEIKNCTTLMLKNNISSLVLLDDEGIQKGIITKSDLVELYAYHFMNKYISKDWMTKKVHTVDLYENIHIILLLMNIHKISRLIVVSFMFRRDKSPSILSKKVSSKYLEQRYLPTRVTSMLVAKDVMIKEPITVSDKTDLADAAKIMTRNGISGLPVVNSNNKLVGIVTKTDIVKALDKILHVRWTSNFILNLINFSHIFRILFYNMV